MRCVGEDDKGVTVVIGWLWAILGMFTNNIKEPIR